MSGAVQVRVEVVILTIRRGRLSVLLTPGTDGQAGGPWRLPGGAVADDEGLDAAALRRLAEQTGWYVAGASAGPGAQSLHLEQVKTYGDPADQHAARRFAVGYLGLLPDLRPPDVAAGGSPGLPPARFWPVEDLGGPDGPAVDCDHQPIVTDALERARAKLEYTTLAAAFCEELFTLADLRRVYEAAWGVALDAPNFRRKVLSAPGFVVALGETTVPRGGGRPAELYRRGPATLLHPPMLRLTSG